MKLIICVDDKDGVLFCGKRQSRDAVLTKRISDIAGESLYITDYSLPLFEGINNNVKVCNGIEEILKTDAYFFNETVFPFEYFSFVTEIIIYRWNRVYPSSVKSGIAPLNSGFKLVSSVDFEGNSHEKITEEVYSL